MRKFVAKLEMFFNEGVVPFLEVLSPNYFLLGNRIRFTDRESGITFTGVFVSWDEQDKLTIRMDDGSERSFGSGDVRPSVDDSSTSTGLQLSSFDECCDEAFSYH